MDEAHVSLKAELEETETRNLLLLKKKKNFYQKSNWREKMLEVALLIEKTK